MRTHCSRTPFPSHLTLPDLFRLQAEATPDRSAARLGDRALSYRELDRRSNQLARLLSKRGVGPEAVVGLQIGRSLELLVAVLGVLKAGGAYVPLDPQYPPSRLEHMAEDSRAMLCLVQSGVPARLGHFEGRELELSPTHPAWSAESDEPLTCPARPANLAYLLYTSGSTGKPKGVEVTHRSVVNFLFSLRELICFSGEERVLSVTGLTFDIAGLDLFLTWMTGAELVLVPREVVFDGPRLAAALESTGATLLQTTPVTWRSVLDGGWKGRPGFKALCGGEAMPERLAREILSRGARLWNLYGPTETTIWSTVRELRPGFERITIGRPIANTVVEILGPGLERCEVGQSGELCIGGEGLARGYRGRAELTAERFVPHAHGNPGARLYRTGDRARLLPDGDLECLGRIDHQIKLHGYRIEPGEIEAALLEAASASHAAVRCVGEDPARRLVAYLVAPHSIDASLVLLRLAERLPAYMMPSELVQLPELPLTPNGKIDRNALARLT